MTEQTDHQPQNMSAGGWPPPTPPPPPGAEATSPAPDPAPVSAAQVAYEAHRDSAITGGRAEADEVPVWAELRAELRSDWEAAAAAVHRRVASRISEVSAGVSHLTAGPGSELPTPTGTTPDASVAVTSWFGHLVSEAQRAEETIRTWLTPAVERGGAEAAKAVEEVIRNL